MGFRWNWKCHGCSSIWENVAKTFARKPPIWGMVNIPIYGEIGMVYIRGWFVSVLRTLVVFVWVCEYPNHRLKPCRWLGTSEQLEAFGLQLFFYSASSNPCMPSQERSDEHLPPSIGTIPRLFSVSHGLLWAMGPKYE